MSNSITSQDADVCLLLEGTYPFVQGGVSSWTHDLIQKQSHLTFHVVSIIPKNFEEKSVYNFPSNVVGHSIVRLQKLPLGKSKSRSYAKDMKDQLKKILTAINTTAHSEDFAKLVKIINKNRDELGSKILLDSQETWEILVDMYQDFFSESSFLDYFWSWRAIMGSLYSILLADLPKAKIYHSMSTGYGGLMAARAKVETGKPAIITEHGIYTNERRIEVASADWLEETASKALTIDKTRRSLRDMWIDTFSSYSRICYEASDRIITLYEGNQISQITDGASQDKMQIISNGVDIEKFSAIPKHSNDSPVIALIGRVVPIKDIKNFIRASAVIRSYIPDVKVYIIGPTDEDEEYYGECVSMIEHLGLAESIIFTGRVNVEDYIGKIDIIVLTSISEAQPLVLLEAGASGIPVVATDVGACREIIYGHKDETPWLGEGGIVAPLSNPTAIAQSVITLLTDKERYSTCSVSLYERTKRYYDKQDQYLAYKELYNHYIQK